ncbi:putative serine protease EDA2 [Gossypium australe]|uniref:Putative serine protease EDA2 n=1 Tax=Gossypium australe TaxID=47621 RepID=A0A5B6VZK5_9ROSI|nr:putative serine protease EDA2 [Gossypium australe]
MGTMRLSKPLVVSVSLLFFVALSGFAHGFVMTPRSLLNRLPQSSYYLTTKELWFDQTLDHYSPYFQVLAKKFGAAVVSLEHRYYGKSSPFKSHTTENLKYLSSKQALFDLAVFRQWYQVSLNLKRNRTGAENSWFVFGVSYSGALSAWFRLKFPHLTCGSLASSAVVLAVYNYTDYDKQVGESAGPECKAVLQEITELVDQSLETNKKELKKQFGAAELEIDGDFFYFLADAAVVAFQYGHPDALCTPLVEAKKAGVDLVAAYAKYVKEYFVGTFGVSVETYNQKHLKNTAVNEGSSDRLWWFQVCTEVAYFQVAPSNDTVRSSKIDTKYVSKYHAIYHLDLCKNVFGEGIYPEVDVTNIYYGGTNIAGQGIIFLVFLPFPHHEFSNAFTQQTEVFNSLIARMQKMRYSVLRCSYGAVNASCYCAQQHAYTIVLFVLQKYEFAGSKIIFTNGSQDPWRHASKQTSSPGMPSYIITCHNCGHGIDMRECPQSVSSIEGNAQSCSIPDAVNKVRHKMIEHIDLWLSECKGSGWHSIFPLSVKFSVHDEIYEAVQDSL